MIVSTSKRIVLEFSAQKLRDLDITSKSDPTLELFDVTGKLSEAPRSLGKTEVIKNNLNPVWATAIGMVYDFEIPQAVKIVVSDSDGANASEEIGFAVVKLSAIVNPKTPGKCEVTLHASNGKPAGLVIVRIRPATDFDALRQRVCGASPGPMGDPSAALYIVQSTDVHADPTAPPAGLSLKFSATNLKAKDVLSGSSDPYFRLWRQTTAGKAEVSKSETIKKCLNPQWKPVKLTWDQLGDGKFFVEVFDEDLLSDDSIGACEIQIPVELRGPPIHSVLKSIKRGTDHGTLIVEASPFFPPPPSNEYCLVEARKVPRDPKTNYGVCNQRGAGLSFVDALRWMQLRTTCALDMTASNGKMHWVTPGGPLNPYEECMQAVGEILQDYDRSNVFELLGYGGFFHKVFPPFFCMPEEGVLSQGVQGMLENYRKSMPSIDLGDMGTARGGDMLWRAHNKKYFCDDFYACINHVCDAAYEDMKHRRSPFDLPKFYRVLFFVIDGDGFDSGGTLRAIIRAGALPVSIVIVGVGPSTFPNLSKYDADDTAPHFDNVTAVRDAVQFVRFEDFRDATNKGVDMLRLRQEVLREIPTQVEQFLELYQLVPPAASSTAE